MSQGVPETYQIHKTPPSPKLCEQQGLPRIEDGPVCKVACNSWSELLCANFHELPSTLGQAFSVIIVF